MTTSDHILQTLDDGTLVVTLNKPAKMNAWDKPMRDDLVTAILRASRDPQVTALVLTGARRPRLLRRSGPERGQKL